MSELRTRPPEEPVQEARRETARAEFFADFAGLRDNWRAVILTPVLAVLSALAVGALIVGFSDVELLRLLRSSPAEGLATAGSSIGRAYGALFRGSFGSIGAISETLVAAAPLLLAGLSVALGFRAGLFNIGAEGQLLVGGMGAVAVGFGLAGLPAVLHVPLGLGAGFLAGAVWGGIPGYLRARTGAHEVITTIMLNFIALRLVDFLLKTTLFQVPGRTDPISKSVTASAQLPRLLSFLSPNLRVHAGILLALAAAWGVYWLLFRSTLGFEFRAVGANPDAAVYAGMSVTRLYVLVMGIAGGLAGLAGANQIMGLYMRAAPGFSAGIGFEAIALALLGRSHPWGVVAAAVLFGALSAGGRQMQAATAIPIDIIQVIQALVIVFIAAPALIRAVYRIRETGGGAEQLTRGWST